MILHIETQRQLPGIAFCVAFLIALSAYALTLAPTVTLEMSGTMVTAADHLGVGHCPGDPAWTLAAWFFQWVGAAARYMGHPNPAGPVNFMSAFFGALTCGLVARMTTTANLWSVADRQDAVVRRCAAVCAVSAALLLGFSHSMWSQSVVAERYTMNAFLVAVFLTYCWRVLAQERACDLFPAAFVVGLAMVTHHESILLLPALALLVGLSAPGIIAALAVLAGVMAVAGTYFAFATPGGWPAAVAILLWCGLVFVVARRLPRGWHALGVVGSLLAGLSLVGYIVFASEQNPPINWGYARTPAGFLHMICLGQFERINPLIALAHPARALALAGNYVRLLADQFMLLPLVAGLIPLFAVRARSASLRRWRWCVAATWALLGPGWMIAMNPGPDVQTQLIVRPRLVASCVAYALLVGQGLFLLVSGQSRRACNRPNMWGY